MTQPLVRSRFSNILDALVSPFTENPEQKIAAEELRNLGTNALPPLMQEVRAVGQVEATNVLAATTRKLKLQAAFKVLGPEAKPLLPELIAEFEAGRCLGTAPYALAQIGGTEAGIVLVKAITNADPLISISGAAAIEFFRDDPAIAKAAVQPLLLRLSNGSGPLRSMAADTLGRLRTEADVVIPALLQTAESDPDSLMRSIAIVSIGRFGTNAAFAESRIKSIAELDSDEHVKKMAAQALLALHGKGEQ